MNFCKRSYQPILRYVYTEVKKCRGEISLYKHFKLCSLFTIAAAIFEAMRMTDSSSQRRPLGFVDYLGHVVYKEKASFHMVMTVVK